MADKLFNILISEPSLIIFEGLSYLLTRSGKRVAVTRADGLSEIVPVLQDKPIDAVILNPSVLQNQSKAFANLKRDFPGLKWIGIVYSYYPESVLKQFDETIDINGSWEQISGKIFTSPESKSNAQETGVQENLSERETDVLKLLVEGLSNKEIADKLFISIHTVITHRKNISQKTGIKSVAGLTIYAVLNKIITLGSIPEQTYHHLK